jgi:hypothetical protein
MKIFKIFTLLHGDFDSEKPHFQAAKAQKFTTSHFVKIRNFYFIFEEHMMAHIKKHTKQDLEN